MVTAAIKRWLEAGLPASVGVDGVRRFDPVEVLNFMKWSSISGGDPFWGDRFLTTGRKLVLDQSPDWMSPVRSRNREDTCARRFKFIFKRKFNFAFASSSGRLRLRLPLPFEDELLTISKYQSRSRWTAEFSSSDGREDWM